MDDRIDSALCETLARIDAGEPVTEERIRDMYPDCWPEVFGALDLSRRLSEMSEAPETIGAWRVVSLLGRGGMGTVYLAQDAGGTRRVALKILAPGLVGSKQARQRLRREAAVAARVEHPGICPVYEACVVDDPPYLVMQYVEGETLDRLVARSRGDRPDSSTTTAVRGPVALPASTPTPDEGRVESDVDRVLLLVERAARALHAAHEAGLVHRDVKPGNVMVTPTGEPVVLDFGLVRDDEASLTRSGALVGTPAYMAPEQIASGGRVPDRRVDVYALGATLYECLSLSRPFDAPTREALYACILRDEPPDLRRVARGVARDTATVVATALAKSPDARYQTALDLAEDLRRARTGRPIRAKEAGAVARVKRFCVRRPGVAVGVAATFVLLAAGLAASIQMRSDLRRTHAIALANASKAAEPFDPMRALLLAREAARVGTSAAVVSQLHSALAQSPAERVFRGHRSGVSTAVFSPFGDVRFVLTASPDGTARISNADGSGDPVVIDGGDGALVSAAFSPTGERVLTLSARGTVEIWGLDGRSIKRLPVGAAVRVAAFAPWGGAIVTGDVDGAVRLWDEDGRPMRGLERHAKAIVALEFSSNTAGRFATASDDGEVRVWNSAGEQIAVLAHDGPLRAFALSSDGRSAVAGYADGSSALWDVASRLATPLAAADGPMTSAAFAPSGDSFVTGYEDGTARLWGGGCVTATDLPGHAGGVSSVAFSSDGGLVATADDGDFTVRVWDKHGRPVASLVGHTRAVNGVRFCPGRDRLATASADGTARTWRAKGWERETFRAVPWTMHVLAASATGSGELLVASKNGPVHLLDRGGKDLGTFGDPDSAIWSARLSSDGRLVVTADAKGKVSVYQRSAAKPGSAAKADFEFQAHHRGCRADFLPDGRILTWSDDSTACVFDKDGKFLFRFTDHEDRVVSAAFSPDGSMIVTGSADRTARVWNSKTGKVVQVLRGHGDTVNGVAFANRHDLVLTAGRGDQTVRIFGLDGVKQHEFQHDSATWVAQFSPDDRTVVAGCADGSASLWDVETETEIAHLPGHSAGVVVAAFEADGKQIVTACKDGNVRVRCIDLHDLLDLVDERITRDFTRSELERYSDLLGGGHDALLAAYRYVEPKLEDGVVVADVVAAVRGDKSLPENVRAEALSILEQRVDDPEHVRGLDAVK